MHYYDFNIADFKSATVHLTRIERSIYRDMLDMYYETEKPLTLDLKDLCRKLIARSDDEKEAVQVILDEFFIKTESGYFNDRCDEVIQKYYNNQTAKSLAGKASAAKREQVRLQRLAELNGQAAHQEQIADFANSDNQQNLTAVEQPLNSVPTESQPVATNQKPITNNQEPLNNLSSSSSGEVVEAKFTDLGFEGLPDQYRDLALTEYPNLKTSTLTGIWQRFAKYYRDKPQVLKNDQGWLSLWAESLERYAQSEIDKASAPKPSRPAKSNYTTPQRQSDTTRPSREQTFDQFTDDMVYSNNLTAGFIRQNRLEGEELDFCVARLVRERFEQEAQQRKREYEAREAAKREEQQRKQQLIDEFEAKAGTL